MQVTTIGLDLANNVFQVHGVDGQGKVIVTRQLRRGQLIEFFKRLPPCLVGMEACGIAHHKERLGGISKQGNRYLRRLYIVGAMAVIGHARAHPQKQRWVRKLLAKKPAKVVAVALANKMARIAWALLANGGTYRAPALAAAA